MAEQVAVKLEAGVEVRQLMNELLGTAAERRTEKVEESRFQSLALAELLVAESERFEEVSPAKAEELAELAESIVDRLDHPRAGRILVRSLCLQANARRLAGDRLGAEAGFERAAAVAVPEDAMERGFYFQRLASLREEQGQAEEAAALLWSAVGIFRAQRAVENRAEAACLCRLGFLSLLENDVEGASQLFTKARGQLGSERASVLSVRCGLGLAVCLAALGQAVAARRLWQESRRSSDVVPDPRGLLELDWLEGRLALRLGDHLEAVGRLSSVRLRLFLQRRLLDAALCSLDMARAYVAMGQEPRIRGLIDDLRRAFPVSFEQARADLALNDYAEAAREARDLERAAMESRDLIRRPFAILRKLRL